MTDTNGETATRTKKADYFYLNAAGSRVDDIEDATGVEYVPTAGGSVNWQIPGVEAGRIATMLAVAGAKIELRNSGRGAAEPEDGSGPAAQRVARMQDYDWGDLAGQGGGRAPIDEDKLIAAMQQVLSAAGKPFNESRIRAAFTSGGTIAGKAMADGKSYKAACLRVGGVEAAYNALVGKATTSVDDAADDFA